MESVTECFVTEALWDRLFETTGYNGKIVSYELSADSLTALECATEQVVAAIVCRTDS